MQVPIVPGEPIVLPIRVHGSNGVREMDALIDTGATCMTIPPEDAIDLGYNLKECVMLSAATASGLLEVPRVILSRVVVLGYEQTDVPAICLDIPVGGVSSLLGLSLLSRFELKLDFKNGRLAITDP